MFQREFARRLIAERDTSEYAFLSCYFQYHACVSLLFDIPRGAFFPKPMVDSSFVAIEFLTTPRFEVDDEDADKTLDGLKSAAPYIQHLMSKQVSLHYIPKLIFRRDESIGKAFDMIEKINSMNIPKADDEDGENE